MGVVLMQSARNKGVVSTIWGDANNGVQPILNGRLGFRYYIELKVYI